MNDREIALRMPVVNEVKFLFAPEPGKPAEPGTFHVVSLVERNMRIKGSPAGRRLNQEDIQGQQQICHACKQDHRNEEEGSVVALFADVNPRHHMVSRIMFVVEIDVVAEQSAAHLVMAQLAMHQRLRKRYDQMGGDGCDEVTWKVLKER